MRINIQAEVNPNFKSVWTTKKPYNVLKGGRNSFKSSVIALLLVYTMIKYIKINEKANIVVIRKVANTLRDSVYLKIQWALRKFGMSVEFSATVSPFKITHVSTGSTFYFYGQDDFQKLKSNDIGNIVAVWYEEAAEFKDFEEFDQSNTTFMRQKHPLADMVRFFWSYNPPRNPYSWINEWADSLKESDSYLVHESSYLDDKLGFVTEQMLDEIERIKKNDYDYYRYLYLGEAVGLGTNVYNANLFQPLKEPPKDERIVALYYGIDTGHQVSATSCVCLGYTSKRNVILLDMFYYSPEGKSNKKAPSQLSKDIHDFMEKTQKEWRVPMRYTVIDSAEGALRNQYYLDYGVALQPVNKQKKVVMIDYVQDLLAHGRFYYLEKPSTDIFIDEHKKYLWNEKTLNSDSPEVIKEYDHSCDALQYIVLTAARDWGLRV